MVVTLRQVPRHRRAWPRIGGTGALLWLACLLVIGVTGNAALVPSLILLGSFLVPVTFVAWAFERWRDEDVTTELIVVAFVVGGLLGTLGAAVLEAYLLHPSALLFLGVGLIEEAAKLVALLAVTRRMTRRHTRDGAVLGAAVGFGFAAFESAGYAFQVLISPGGSLAAMVSTELLRGVLAPFGHGLWTAILGAAAFHRLARLRSTRTAAAQAASNGGGVRRPQWTDGLGGGVLVAYLWVAVLHALWDAMRDLATAAVLLFTATPGQRRLLADGYLPPVSPAQDRLLLDAQIGGLVVVSLLGLVTLALIWARTRAWPPAAGVSADDRQRPPGDRHPWEVP